MYRFKYDPHNHRCEIHNSETKKGVTLHPVGGEMAIFLKKLVFDANHFDFSEPTGNVTDLRNVMFSNGTSTAHQALASMLDGVGKDSFVAGALKVLEEYTEPTPMATEEGGD